jgi:hypothetical protein
MAWFYPMLLVAVPVVLILLSVRSRRGKPDKRAYQVLVDLHAIRRRFDLAQFKFELRRDAADARRALRADLRKLSKRDNS